MLSRVIGDLGKELGYFLVMDYFKMDRVFFVTGWF